MSIDLLLQLLAFVFLLLSNLVFVTIYFQKQNARIKACEDKDKDLSEQNTILFKNDKLHIDEFKTLYEIKGQLELLISHFSLKKY